MSDAPFTPPARRELPLLDPQVARQLRLVPAYFFDKVLGVLAADEYVK